MGGSDESDLLSYGDDEDYEADYEEDEVQQPEGSEQQASASSSARPTCMMARNSHANNARAHHQMS